MQDKMLFPFQPFWLSTSELSGQLVKTMVVHDFPDKALVLYITGGR